MVLEQLTCPRCGAEVHLREGAAIVHCEYCGTDSLLEALSPRAPEAPVSDEARAELRSRQAATARSARVVVAIVGSLVVAVTGMFIGVIWNVTAKRDAQQARAARYQADVADSLERLRAVQAQMTDASQRRDPTKLRAAQAELTRIQDEISRRQQEYLRGR